jgi:hypothetical protein
MRDGVSDTSAAQNSVVQQLLVVELCKLKTLLSTNDPSRYFEKAYLAVLGWSSLANTVEIA